MQFLVVNLGGSICSEKGGSISAFFPELTQNIFDAEIILPTTAFLGDEEIELDESMSMGNEYLCQA